MNDLNSFHDFSMTVDRLIKEGNGGQAIQLLKKISVKKLTVPELEVCANLARRVELFPLVLKWLRPWVKSDVPIYQEPTVKMLLEYGVSLIGVGAIQEGLNILEKIDCNTTPEAALLKCHGLFNQWRYDESIELLKFYINSVDSKSYARLIGNLNLASALLFIRRFSEAIEILDKTLAAAEKGKNFLVVGHCHEMLAEIYLHKNKLNQSTYHLTQSHKHLETSSPRNKLFIQKLNCVRSLMENGPSSHSIECIKTAQNSAFAIQNWETLRELDLYLAKYSDNKSLLEKVIFGTPYESYKKHALNLCGFSRIWINEFQWIDKNKNLDKIKLKYDTKLSSFAGSQNVHIKAGSIFHILIRSLSRDLYRPLSVGNLFEKVYENEFYNPETSPGKIYQNVLRLRTFLNENRIPIEIAESSGFYSILEPTEMAIVLHYDYVDMDKPEKMQLVLRDKFKINEFTASEAAHLLNTSKRNIQRTLRPALDSGKVIKMGSGKSIKYKFAA
ncbi:MAG: tetratricopeptide repeat protein [Bdellovibrionales bacterium]|nr:tetratricopeptide repeat protein [Bdellovibrionales bacterium]